MLAVKFTANEFRKQFVLEKSAANGRTAQLQRESVWESYWVLMGNFSPNERNRTELGSASFAALFKDQFSFA